MIPNPTPEPSLFRQKQPDFFFGSKEPKHKPVLFRKPKSKTKKEFLAIFKEFVKNILKDLKI